MDHYGQEPPDEALDARRERGAGLVEYALLVALIAIVCFASLQMFGVTNGGSINSTADTYASYAN